MSKLTTREKSLFIATCIIWFFAGFTAKEYSEEALMREYESEIEWQNKRYNTLTNLLMNRNER